jgi:hypothetical protein
MNKLCHGCSATIKNFMTINGPVHCELQPVFEGKECPCIQCVVKVICKEDDESCKQYYETSVSKICTKERRHSM